MIRNINFRIEFNETTKGRTLYFPIITYEEKGFLWGWNKKEILIPKDKFTNYGEEWLAGMWLAQSMSKFNDVIETFENFEDIDEAKQYAENMVERIKLSTIDKERLV
jgi:hypothetical protein